MMKRHLTPDALNALTAASMSGALGIRFTCVEAERLEAVMPLSERTRQPFGLLHGGASATLAETLGSAAGYLCCAEGEQLVGLELTISHLRSVTEGEVRGVCRPLHCSRRRQLWDIAIYDAQARLCASARLTTLIVTDRKDDETAR